MEVKLKGFKARIHKRYTDLVLEAFLTAINNSEKHKELWHCFHIDTREKYKKSLREAIARQVTACKFNYKNLSEFNEYNIKMIQNLLNFYLLHHIFFEYPIVLQNAVLKELRKIEL